MGHQESDVWPFSRPFGECSHSKLDTRGQVGVPCSRDSVPVLGGRRVFGVPLEQLVTAGHSGVPRVVGRLCHFIERHGMQTEGLFRTPGNQRAVAKIRADFDTYGDSNLERYKDVAAAAGCLKTFLREMPEAVVPARYTPNFVTAIDDYDSRCRRCEKLSILVHSLPPSHYALLRYLCSFLRRVTNFHCAAQMSPDTLGIVFGPNVFRVSPSTDGGAPCLEQQAATNRLLAQLITNYDRIFNDLGQRQRPSSDDRHSCLDRGDDSDASASTGGIQRRVDKSIQAAVASHLLSTVTDAGDRSGEPPCKRLEGDDRAASFESLARLPARRSQHPWPAGRSVDCVRRTSSHDDVRESSHHHHHHHHSHHDNRRHQQQEWRSHSAHQMAPETEPISVPAPSCTQGYDLPTPWSPVYTDEVIESTSSSSSSSECGDTPPAVLQQILCRHEQERESERLATFPRSRDKTSRSSRDVRRRRHSRGDGKDTSPSCSPAEGDDCEFEDEGADLSDAESIPPLNLVCMGSEPISSTVLKGRQLTEDEVILSPRNSFVLPDAEFVAEQEKLCSRFNERLPASPAAGTQAEPRSHQLRQTIASAKRKVRAYEESFERRHGYRPSHADRQKDAEMKRCLAELSRARRELKQLKQEAGPACPPAPERGERLERGVQRQKENRTPPGGGEVELSLQRTVADVTKRLSEKRETAGRPQEPDAMSRDQVLAEKLALQKALLCLEERHGRPAQKRDRDLVRPLYERYRLVKRLAVKAGSPKLRDSIGELTPILEHETMTFTAADRPAISELDDELEPSGPPPGGATERLQLDDNLHNLPVSELKSQLSRAKDEKRRLRTRLLVFEEDFRSTVGRKVQKDDRGDMDDVYAEYKQVKAKVKLLEVLVAKHRSRAYTM